MKPRLVFAILASTVFLCSMSGQKINYTYDALNRLTRASYADGTAVTYTFDSAGNRLSQVVSNPAIALPTIRADKTNLTFSAPAGQASAGAQLVTIQNTGAGALQWNANASVPWISVTPGSGTDTGVINVSVSAASLAAGSYAGSVMIFASASNAPITIPVMFIVTASQGNPSIQSGGITSAAGFQPGVTRGSVATIFGSSLSASTAQAESVPLPRRLSNVQVTVNGVAAPLWYVDGSQINFQIPFESPLQGAASIVVTRDGVSSSPVNVDLVPYAPSVFTYQRIEGVLDPIIVHAANNQLVTPSSPAVPGESVIVYGTGIGDLSVVPVTGEISPSAPLARSKATAAATIGGLLTPVSFAGLTPGAIGLAQFNLQVPQGLPPGTSLPLVIAFGAIASQPVQLYVGSAASPSSSTQIVGRVVWSSTPVPGAGVELKAVGDYYQLPALLSIRTGSDGSFVLANPPIGDLMIYCVSPSSEYWDWAGYSLSVVAGKRIDIGDLALSKKLELLLPLNGSVVSTTTPTLQWTAFPGTTRYDVSVFNNRTLERVFLQSTSATQVTISPALKAGEVYQWGVYANDSIGQIAYWSNWVFRVSQ